MTTPLGGRPLKFKTVEELQTKIDAYFNWCDSQRKEIPTKNGVKVITKPYTITGLALWLDTTRETLMDYQEGKHDNYGLNGTSGDLGNICKFSDTVKRAKLRVENYVEEGSLSGELQPITSIFNLKNNFGWVDKTEVVSTNAPEKLSSDDIKNLSE